MDLIHWLKVLKLRIYILCIDPRYAIIARYRIWVKIFLLKRIKFHHFPFDSFIKWAIIDGVARLQRLIVMILGMLPCVGALNHKVVKWILTLFLCNFALLMIFDY